MTSSRIASLNDANALVLKGSRNLNCALPPVCDKLRNMKSLLTFLLDSFNTSAAARVVRGHPSSFGDKIIVNQAVIGDAILDVVDRVAREGFAQLALVKFERVVAGFKRREAVNRFGGDGHIDVFAVEGAADFRGSLVNDGDDFSALDFRLAK